MPVPKPNSGEERQKFISRCMGDDKMNAEYEQKQRAAICYRTWRAHSRQQKALENLTPEQLLNGRPEERLCCDLSGYCWKCVPEVSQKLAPASQMFALDSKFVPEVKNLDIDEKRMCARCYFAAGIERDRVGDFLEVGGIECDNHRKNPICLLDHGKNYHDPIAVCEDEKGNYTVVLDTQRQLAHALTFFGKKSLVAEQTFNLICDKLLRAGSIGYRPVETMPLPPYPQKNLPAGLHLKRVELLEVTWTPLGAHPEAVRACLSQDKVCGKSLESSIKLMLEPFAAEGKVWSNGMTIDTKALPNATPTDKQPSRQGADTQNSAGTDPNAPQAEPYGAQVIRRVHEDLNILQKDYDEMTDVLEQPQVKDHMLKLTHDLDDAISEVLAIYQAIYPELPPLDGAEENGDMTGIEPRLGEDVDRKKFLETVHQKRQELREFVKKYVSGKAAMSSVGETSGGAIVNPAGVNGQGNIDSHAHDIVHQAVTFLHGHIQSDNLTDTQKKDLLEHATRLGGLVGWNDGTPQKPGTKDDGEEEDGGSTAQQVTDTANAVSAVANAVGTVGEVAASFASMTPQNTKALEAIQSTLKDLLDSRQKLFDQLRRNGAPV